MDRSSYILAKHCEGVNDDVRRTCCDSLMLAIHNNEIASCEKYGHLLSTVGHSNTFQKNLMDCCFYKRDRKCSLASLV
ncbi:MAG: hypothetical protein FWG98_08730 [Candidatus Cloacimonetes bacterium]|nr:hypothetical protein [Candidatus Cloacimonadota bacterium]